MIEAGIYGISIDNKVVYVGQSLNLMRREKQHRKALEQNKHVNIHLQNKYNKYNNFKFIILERCGTDLSSRESYWYQKYKKQLCNFQEPLKNNTYKVSPETTAKRVQKVIGSKRSLETRLKMSEAQSGENNPWYGKKQSSEANKKRSETLKKYYSKNIHHSRGSKGAIWTDDMRKKQSEKLKGKPNPFKGKPRSDETRQRISKSIKEWHEKRKQEI